MIETIHGTQAPSPWLQKWAHLISPKGTVLDVACGAGRHMQYFAQRGHPVTGVDRSEQSLQEASAWGRAVQADIENNPWPFAGERFDAVVVTNYLWRSLMPQLLDSLAPEGVLLYETFAIGNETVGKPSRPDFLLQPGELLRSFASLRVIAYENGYLDHPARFIQRIAAVRENPPAQPKTYLL